MVDLFEEVEDELRSEQYKSAIRRVLPWLLGAIFGIVAIGGGWLGWTTYQDRRVAEASEAYDAAIDLLVQGNMEGGFSALEEVAGSGPRIYRYIALNQQAAIRLEQDQNEQAIALFDRAAEVAPRSEAGVILADMARLKAAWLLVDTAPYDDIAERLAPLTDPDRPLSAAARYAMGLAKLLDGQMDEAKTDFTVLSADPDAPQQTSQAAQLIVEFIDSGQGALIADITRQALETAPPEPQNQLTEEMLQQLLQGAEPAEGVPAQ